MFNVERKKSPEIKKLIKIIFNSDASNEKSNNYVLRTQFEKRLDLKKIEKHTHKNKTQKAKD